ncbi:hypothetical protein MLD38_032273 [Melastoma candidum]|uniref:Uncharacterized protein n=1 Tax=Melastoma candidum TaxID=119954 RepID=A0ACB9M3A0_9MYRT|nr:hypothetical protein MLD38_032273 [Melastoma candidum]
MRLRTILKRQGTVWKSDGEKLILAIQNSVLETPVKGWIMAIVSSLIVYTEVTIKKRPFRNINVQCSLLYIFGMIFNIFAIFCPRFQRCPKQNRHQFVLLTVALPMVMEYADNIVKVYSTLQCFCGNRFGVSPQISPLPRLRCSWSGQIRFSLSSLVVSVSVYVHSVGKVRR